uniref:ADP-ribosylation factor-like protein 13B n=1 Tax=Syphacia muris TaxID=451379 RepID=A0A0N5AKG2_9BILA
SISRKICLCILGVDGVGKSTIVRALANEDITKVLPTNGFTFSKINYNTVKIVFYDLGGGERIRDIWSNYYSETYGVVFVVDGTDTEHIEDNKKLLSSVVSNSDLSSKPLLLLINKKDQSGCFDEIQLSDKLGLHELAERHRTQIRECCSAIHGTGKNIDPSISDGIEWLLDRILERYNSLAKRVTEAEERLKIQQKEDRLNRMHRLTSTNTLEK